MCREWGAAGGVGVAHRAWGGAGRGGAKRVGWCIGSGVVHKVWACAYGVERFMERGVFLIGRILCPNVLWRWSGVRCQYPQCTRTPSHERGGLITTI